MMRRGSAGPLVGTPPPAGSSVPPDDGSCQRVRGGERVPGPLVWPNSATRATIPKPKDRTHANRSRSILAFCIRAVWVPPPPALTHPSWHRTHPAPLNPLSQRLLSPPRRLPSARSPRHWLPCPLRAHHPRGVLTRRLVQGGGSSGGVSTLAQMVNAVAGGRGFLLKSCRE